MFTPTPLESPVEQRLLHRLVGVVQVGAFADDRDVDPVGEAKDPLCHRLPRPEIRLSRLQVQALADHAVEPLLLEADRDFVNRLHVRALDYAAGIPLQKRVRSSV